MTWKRLPKPLKNASANICTSCTGSTSAAVIITRPDYDIPRLISVIEHFRDRYDVQIYLEPGEATVYHAGFLVSSVLETMHNGMEIAILDTSAACHMPDVLEMPYRPPLLNSGEAGEKPHTYRLGGYATCLAGDIIGDYSFDQPLCPGERFVLDMALYTMVKTNTFNGMPTAPPSSGEGHLQDGVPGQTIWIRGFFLPFINTKRSRNRTYGFGSSCYCKR